MKIYIPLFDSLFINKQYEDTAEVIVISEYIIMNMKQIILYKKER